MEASTNLEVTAEPLPAQRTVCVKEGTDDSEYGRSHTDRDFKRSRNTGFMVSMFVPFCEVLLAFQGAVRWPLLEGTSSYAPRGEFGDFSLYIHSVVKVGLMLPGCTSAAHIAGLPTISLGRSFYRLQY